MFGGISSFEGVEDMIIEVRTVLLYGENISFVVSRVLYMNNTSIPLIKIMNRMYDIQNLLYIVPRHITELCHCLNIMRQWHIPFSYSSAHFSVRCTRHKLRHRSWQDLIIILTLRRLMSYIYGAPILDVSRSHTTTQHSR